MAWMIIRVRGSIHARHDIVQTLHDLHLTRPNHATLVPEDPAARGMITAVQGYVTWGEADAPTVQRLLTERGEKPTGGRLDAASDFATLAGTAAKGGFRATKDVRPLVRLKAPKGGWRSTKKPFAQGGALGYRGKAINELATRML